MKAFTRESGTVLPLDRVNVDTDQIIPKQFLKSIRRTGFGDNLFDGWRFLDEGDMGMTPNERQINHDFVLNDPRYQGARFLLARENFGCGSSREHAVWALMEYGFRAVIAPSFADIFHSNCYKNGLLPITLGYKEIEYLFSQVAKFAERNATFSILVDLEEQSIVDETGKKFNFDIHEFQKYCLLNGLDEIDHTLQFSDKIRAYEERMQKTTPWLFND